MAFSKFVLLIFAMMTCSLASAQGTAYPDPACGMNSAFDFKCGPVAPFPAALGSPITPACAADTVLAAGNNKLSASCDVGKGNIAFIVNSANTTLDLNGFTLNGRVTCTSGCGGMRVFSSVYGGQINCTFIDSGANAGCIRIDSGAPGSPQTVPNRIDHLTIDNDADPGAGGTRAIYVSRGDSPYSGSDQQVEIDHLRIVSHTATTAARMYLLYVQSAPGGSSVHDNDFTCAADTSACQAAMCFGAANCRIYHNRFNMVANTTLQGGRAIGCDAQGGTAGSADGCWAWENYIIANDARAFRERKAAHTRFFNNTVTSISNSGSSCAVHVGDADSGVDQPDADFQGYGNTFEFAAGGTPCIIMGRNMTGAAMFRNTVKCPTGGSTCASAYFSNVRTPTAPGTLSTLDIWNNPTVGSISLTTGNKVETGATLNLCNSGTTSGAGTANTVPCP